MRKIREMCKAMTGKYGHICENGPETKQYDGEGTDVTQSAIKFCNITIFESHPKFLINFKISKPNNLAIAIRNKSPH